MTARVVVVRGDIGDVDPPLTGLLTVFENALAEWEVKSGGLGDSVESLDMIRVVDW